MNIKNNTYRVCGYVEDQKLYLEAIIDCKTNPRAIYIFVVKLNPTLNFTKVRCSQVRNVSYQLILDL